MFRPSTLAIALLSVVDRGAYASEADSSSYRPRPYIINVSPSFIEDTRLKASLFRPSQDISTPAWFDGAPTSVIAPLAKYWAEDYDWFKEQDRINSDFSHFIIKIPKVSTKYNHSEDLHFIHQRSPRDDAIPLLMLHGWPSTSLEWEKVIPDLVNPQNESAPAFHVVAPDVPGFGFSLAPTTAPGFDASVYAAVFASLMQQLGYSRYALYSTYLGFVVALKMVVEYKAQIINHITDLYTVFATASDLARYAANATTKEETAYITSINAYNNEFSAYARVHSTLPLSIAHALSNSPVGALAWIYQLLYQAGDQNDTDTEIITRTMLLYIPGLYGNIRAYKELFSVQNYMPDQTYTVPTSVLRFGGTTRYPIQTNLNYVVSSSPSAIA
ncbi:Alpha/Beta hydrolase protein [Bipolaris maydis]|uniref:Alpha/Beta hydrolase protein n=1 Tax=Cochliobolus heterostrophus TaxID=5016 RepID=UPI0024DD6D41|nr:Alpha/Beta hydrolase protein [Bipolaris maydis]KAJ6268018.1 Alpha/Beta hydrolase protein [Bipolaris maydis]